MAAVGGSLRPGFLRFRPPGSRFEMHLPKTATFLNRLLPGVAAQVGNVLSLLTMKILQRILLIGVVIAAVAGVSAYATWRLHPRNVVQTRTVTVTVTQTLPPPPPNTLTVRFGSFGCSVPRDHHYIIRVPGSTSGEGEPEGAPTDSHWNMCVLVVDFAVNPSGSFFQVWDLDQGTYWGPFAWSQYQGHTLSVCYGHRSGCPTS